VIPGARLAFAAANDMRHFLALLVASVSLLLSVPGARADAPPGWEATFDAPAIQSYLPAGELQIMVLGVGPASPGLRAPTDAFTAALRASGRVATVLDDASVGELGAVDDVTALARVRSLPVTHVAIVRLLGGEPPKALISIYAKGGGEPIASFIATAGVAPAPGVRPSENTAGGGVSRAAVDKVDHLTEEAQADTRAAKERYHREYVGYDGFDIEIHAGNGWATANVRTRFYLGDAKDPVEGAEFYRAVGRDDLASSYETRENTRIGFMVGGVVVGLAALIPVSQWEDCDVFGPDWDACNSRNDHRMIWGTVLLGTGTLAFTVARLVDPEPVDDETRRGLADEHNASLRSTLHLDASRARKPHRSTWALAPAVGPSYQGVNLALTF
jgi:hypothetical protein